ncbi:MAG TPA: thioesterase family protein [Candidatus Deferrimicrobium sp.]|nr:thioesterase family protein [Candidatus Deferrimicrobium sp.]
MHTVVRLPEADPAGVLFFGNYFRLVHDSYESFMESIGFGLPQMLRDGDYLLVIAHAEADYVKPVRFGEKIDVSLRVEHIGGSSFVLSYAVMDADGVTAATLKTIHVAIDKANWTRIKLPPKLKEKFEQLKSSQ